MCDKTNSCCKCKPKNILFSVTENPPGTYQDSALKDLMAMQDFNVFTNNGAGTLLRVNEGYTFDPVTYTIAAPIGDYIIIF